MPATFLLFCILSLKERTCETKKSISYFTVIALFILEIIKYSGIQVPWSHQIPKQETQNAFYSITGELNTIWQQNSLCNISKQKLSKYYKKSVTCKLASDFINFQKILCKYESEEVFMMNWINFDGFAIIYFI